MPQPHDRRTFLATAAALGCGTLLDAAPRSARAVEPVKRTGTPQFKYSLAAYSYRDLLTGKTGNLTLDDFIADCAKFGCEGTELTSYYFPKDATPEYIRGLKKRCFELGLDVSGTAIRDDLCLPKGEKRDAEIAWVKQWIDNSEILGAPVIRVFSGDANEKLGVSKEEAHRLAVEGFEECCDYAGKHGVFLALENHGGLTATAEGLLAIVRDVKSPWFGINFDSGNFHSDDPYAELEQIAPYALNVQIKVVITRGPKKSSEKEPSDFKRLAKMMRNVGYRGYVVLEYEEAEDPRAMCPKFLDEIRAAFA